MTVYQFLAYMGKYFSVNLERFDDKSMAFLLSMLANNPPNISSSSSQSSQPSSLQSALSANNDAVSTGVNEKFLSDELIRTHIKRVLAQQNFTVQNYITIVGTSFQIMSKPEHNRGVERKELPCRHDLDFWVDIVRYVPRLQFAS